VNRSQSSYFVENKIHAEIEISQVLRQPLKKRRKKGRISTKFAPFCAAYRGFIFLVQRAAI
jgi:hypothetical protein